MFVFFIRIWIFQKVLNLNIHVQKIHIILNKTRLLFSIFVNGNKTCRCNILTCMIFHHLTKANVNTCPIPVHRFSCSVHAKTMYCMTQECTQMDVTSTETFVKHNIWSTNDHFPFLIFQTKYTSNKMSSLQVSHICSSGVPIPYGASRVWLFIST